MLPLNIKLMEIQTSFVSMLVGLVVFSAWGIWWFVRKRRQRIWLPTLRIMDLESRRLPKLRVIPPPWLIFACFVLASLSVLIFSLRPAQQIFTPYEPNQNRVHIFLDLSPSISAISTIEGYRNKVLEVYDTLQGHGRVTLTSSSSNETFEPTSREALQQWLKVLDYHRAGLKLGVTLRKQLETLGDIDRLFILSDSDQASWDGFNWQFLLDEMEITHVPVPQNRKEADRNVYINRATFLSSQSSLTMDWDVEVAVSGKMTGVSGQLHAALENGETVASVPFAIPEGRDRANVAINWPISAVKKTIGPDQPPLVFSIESDGDDAIAMDNTFRTNLLGAKQEILLVAESGGEMFLEDSAHHLKSSLEVLGFRVKRLDRFPDHDLPLSQYPLWIVLAGGGSSLSDTCPLQIEKERINFQSSTEGGRIGNGTLPHIWLVPANQKPDYHNLCWCFAKLTLSESIKAPLPSFCEDVTAREPWIGVLSSLGAKQIGGQVDNAFQSLAWHMKDKNQRVEVTAFTVPLRPSVATGITYAGLPLMVRSLLQWSGLLQGDPSLRLESWPRLSDPITLGSDIESLHLTQDKIAKTNVPVGESRLMRANANILPPQWASQTELGRKEMPSRKDQKDPMPWLVLCGIILLIAILVEGIVKGSSAIIKVAGKRKDVLLILLALTALTPRAEAQIKIIYLDDNPVTQTLSSMAREVAGRTSIDLDSSILNSSELDESTQGQPWIWTKGISKISGKNGGMLPAVAAWIKRGGILVIQDVNSDQILENLTRESGIEIGEGDGWKAIPPDHELMRSFHLLESLPVCSGQVWRGFHFDGRLAILVIPFNYLPSIVDQRQPVACLKKAAFERDVRVFINILMVGLTTDYKKDQIHLPEILKRLR